MTDGAREAGAAGVPGKAKQAAEAEPQTGKDWSWVEPGVWTARMLAALEQGVKGGKWFSLLDKVYAERTLRAAWRRVERNSGSAGVDRQSVAAFAARAEEYLAELARELRAGTYHPREVRRVWIPKPGRAERRPLGIPTVKDRVVQTALKQQVRCAGVGTDLGGGVCRAELWVPAEAGVQGGAATGARVA